MQSCSVFVPRATISLFAICFLIVSSQSSVDCKGKECEKIGGIEPSPESEEVSLEKDENISNGALSPSLQTGVNSTRGGLSPQIDGKQISSKGDPSPEPDGKQVVGDVQTSPQVSGSQIQGSPSPTQQYQSYQNWYQNSVAPLSYGYQYYYPVGGTYQYNYQNFYPTYASNYNNQYSSTGYNSLGGLPRQSAQYMAKKTIAGAIV
eukprot:TRINITY_DN704_c0_g1_i3.p2 TRINITY_DN704_c0_g1~~TRINITY_DN704_c0_g1_i3.p2  ORF type:complete len:205 (-),score=8.03 TRINITY_DN704_c0_g1_i3:205-819(-)